MNFLILILVLSPLSLPTSETLREAWCSDVSHSSYRTPCGCRLQPSCNLSLPKRRLGFQQPERIRPGRASRCSPLPGFRTPVVPTADGKSLPSLPSAQITFFAVIHKLRGIFHSSSIIRSLNCWGKHGLGAWSAL